MSKHLQLGQILALVLFPWSFPGSITVRCKEGARWGIDRVCRGDSHGTMTLSALWQQKWFFSTRPALYHRFITFPGCWAFHEGPLPCQGFRQLPFNQRLFCLNQSVPFLLLATKNTDCLLQVISSHENKNVSVSSASYSPKFKKQRYLIHDQNNAN